MPTQFPYPPLGGSWLKRRSRCLQCRRTIVGFDMKRWCSAECEDYWVQDCI